MRPRKSTSSQAVGLWWRRECFKLLSPESSWCTSWSSLSSAPTCTPPPPVPSTRPSTLLFLAPRSGSLGEIMFVSRPSARRSVLDLVMVEPEEAPPPVRYSRELPPQ
ncbi:hypothetical protein BJV77DRAFT_1071439 [Russula vinacea]|nr:hypothetical protein BJV77DRAFT_1071439 [Russula vinacea]